MSKGCARNSKKACGGRVAGRAVRIDDVLSCESRPALMFELRASDRQSGSNPANGVMSGLPTIRFPQMAIRQVAKLCLRDPPFS